jgi:hypothetical protein
MMRTLLTICLLGLIGFQSGCTKPAAETKVSQDTAAEGPKHDGWWCVEHGIPEAECALCTPKVAADLKKKGDWCKEHDRPESQCFICHPELEQKFAARYEAKYGSKPPAREE